MKFHLSFFYQYVRFKNEILSDSYDRDFNDYDDGDDDDDDDDDDDGGGGDGGAGGSDRDDGDEADDSENEPILKSHRSMIDSWRKSKNVQKNEIDIIDLTE